MCVYRGASCQLSVYVAPFHLTLCKRQPVAFTVVTPSRALAMARISCPRTHGMGTGLRAHARLQYCNALPIKFLLTHATQHVTLTWQECKIGSNAILSQSLAQDHAVTACNRDSDNVPFLYSTRQQEAGSTLAFYLL